MKIAEEQIVSGAVRTGGRGSVDRHSWDLISEPIICVSRGRNPENSSDRTPGNDTQQRMEFNESGTSNCLSTVQKDNYVAEPIKYIKESDNTVSLRIKNESGDYCVQGKVFAKENADCGTTILANQRAGVVWNHGKSYRIRKLTPRECWRLMDYSDEDFDKAQAMGTAERHLYRQAGNGIVVACLEGIYDKLFVHTELTEPKQLSLF